MMNRHYYAAQKLFPLHFLSQMPKFSQISPFQQFFIISFCFPIFVLQMMFFVLDQYFLKINCNMHLSTELDSLCGYVKYYQCWGYQQKTIIIYYMSNKMQFFRAFLERVTLEDSIKDSLLEAESKYHIKSYSISEITPQKALEIFQCINTKFYKKTHQNKTANWFENQLRLFVWIAVCYCHLNNVKIEQLGKQAWGFFQNIFVHKDPSLFEYQCHSLYLDNKGRVWQLEEENILKSIMKTYGNISSNSKIKWNQVSKQLFQLSQKQYLRNPKQCRERWNNHLDPSKVKGMWKRQEYIKMFEYVREHGKKWAHLVKIFNHTRNQHSIKNKFNSMVKRHLKSNKEKGTVLLNDNQIYSSIIKKVESAITNQRNHQNYDQINFDDEEIVRPQKRANDQRKGNLNFAQKLMFKLRNFGVEHSGKKEVEKTKNSKSLQESLKEQAKSSGENKSSSDEVKVSQQYQFDIEEEGHSSEQNIIESFEDVEAGNQESISLSIDRNLYRAKDIFNQDFAFEDKPHTTSVLQTSLNLPSINSVSSFSSNIQQRLLSSWYSQKANKF